MSKFRNERFDCVECGKEDSVESLDHVLCPKCLKKAMEEQVKEWERTVPRTPDGEILCPICLDNVVATVTEICTECVRDSKEVE